MAHDELWKMTAVEAVARLHKKEITPLLTVLWKSLPIGDPMA